MKVLGINFGHTEKGMILNDGGACLIDDGKIFAIAEERITKQKYAGGFEASIDYCLEAAKISKNLIDVVAVSSCCESPRKNISKLQDIFPNAKVIVVPSHHLSHAYSTYYTSKFDEALIMVLDNEGNIINDLGNDNYFDNELEKMSYYIGRDNHIQLLERDAVEPNSIGVGEAYRFFTHYIGFPSYVYAGKTMGLAPYGTDNFKDVKIFGYENDSIKCYMKQSYNNPNKEVKRFFKEEYNIDLPDPRLPIDEFDQVYKDLAYHIQNQLEQVVVEKVKSLVKRTGIKKLCLAGGVALNSVMNGRILTETDVEEIYIVPAAGDTGQCLGNALYAYHHELKVNDRIPFENAYLGKEYSELEIREAVEKTMGNYDDLFLIHSEEYDEIADLVAFDLNEGKIIANFQGRSEFGPRSLGNRSILMSPCCAENKDILNARVKFREAFRPFAPSILEERYNEFFELKNGNPYMLVVDKVKKPELIPAVTHIDGTARVQSVSKLQNSRYYNLIHKFEKYSGVPVLLNTSFNIADEPIVESPGDALRVFLNTNIDKLMIGNFILSKGNTYYRD